MYEIRLQAMQMALNHFPSASLEQVMRLAEDIIQFVLGDAAQDAPKPARKAKVQPAPEPTPEADDVDAELLAPVEPMPETGKGVVDAGTGQPAGKGDAPIKMTMDDVKVAAAKLVAKDQAKLAEILKTYDAINLSGVPKDKLGDFAADVMEALG